MEKISAKYVDDLIDDDEIPELTEEDFQHFRSFSELPQDEREALLSLKNGPVEIRHTVGIAPEVVAGFRARGADWEKQMEAVLRDWLRDHAA